MKALSIYHTFLPLSRHFVDAKRFSLFLYLGDLLCIMKIGREADWRYESRSGSGATQKRMGTTRPTLAITKAGLFCGYRSGSILCE